MPTANHPANEVSKFLLHCESWHVFSFPRTNRVHGVSLIITIVNSVHDVMTHIVGGVKTQGWAQINDIVFETQLSLTEPYKDGIRAKS